MGTILLNWHSGSVNSIILKISYVNPFIIENRFLNSKLCRKYKILVLEFFVLYSVSILHIKGINKHTKNKKYSPRLCFIFSLCEPIPGEKCVCSSIVFKIYICSIISYDAYVSVYFPRYLLQTSCKSDTYTQNNHTKSYQYRRSFTHNPPLLLLYSHVIPCREFNMLRCKLSSQVNKRCFNN